MGVSDLDLGTDEEFLLDAPDAASADANVLVPVEESNEDGMQIDEEGLPRFAPARDIVSVNCCATIYYSYP
jgi:RNA-binding protein PNO1